MRMFAILGGSKGHFTLLFMIPNSYIWWWWDLEVNPLYSSFTSTTCRSMMDDEFRCVKLQNYTELQILFEMRAHQTRNMHTGNISLSDCVCVCWVRYVLRYIPRTLNDPCFDWNFGLVLEGWPSKIEVCWVLGIWYMYSCNTSYMLTQFIFATFPSRHNQPTFATLL